MNKFLLYWIVLNHGLYISFKLTLVLRYTLSRDHLVIHIADVGIFSDNADKTVFEFLEAFKLGYIDWGNNRQRASKLCKHLSDDLKDKLMTRSDNYA